MDQIKPPPRRRTGRLFVLACLVGLVSWMFWPGSLTEMVDVYVEEGDNAHDVADAMIDAGLIQWSLPFLMWIKIRNASSSIQIGKYRFAEGRSAFWLVYDLMKGRTEKVKVVIPEGFASWQIAERLDELKICRGDEFKKVVAEKQLEGYLFPATYELANGLAPSTVARRMVSEFDQRWTSEFDRRAKEIGFSKKETVTMASIVEREVRVRDELPLVSAVYHNRLKKNMRLEADPTVQFALGYWKGRLTYADYHQTQSPYNTYIHSGLPPGPICSPGEDAVRAALWPAQSKALFFLAADDGRHSFSENYRDHTNKVNRRNRKRR